MCIQVMLHPIRYVKVGRLVLKNYTTLVVFYTLPLLSATQNPPVLPAKIFVYSLNAVVNMQLFVNMIHMLTNCLGADE